MKTEYKVNYFKINLIQTEFNLTEIIPGIELSDYENYYLIQLLRKSFPTNLFLEWSNKIFILNEFIENFLNEFKKVDFELLGIDSFEIGDKIKLNPKDENKINLTRVLFAQILATQLRLNNFHIQPRGSFAFHASISSRVESHGLLESWPGFEFHFEIINASVYLIMDSKYKLNWLQNARDASELKIIQNNIINLEPLKDICSIINCSERKHSYSLCKLGGVGQTIYFHEFKIETPTEKFDVKLFLDKIKCPTQLLTQSIKDETPVILASTNPSKKPSKYPLERISRIPTFDLLESSTDTRRLVRKLQPNPTARYQKIMEYYNGIGSILIENIEKIEIEKMLTVNSTQEDIIIFRRKDFIFNSGTDKQVNSIKNYGPYSLLELDKFYCVNLIENDPVKRKDDLLTHLLQKTNIFEGMFGYLKIDQIPIEEIQIDKVIELNEGSVVLLILENDKQEHIYHTLKKESISKNISIVKITFENFHANRNKRDSIARNHLRNISLNWLSKSSGTSYVLDNSKRGESIIVGWFINIRKMPKTKISQVRISLTMYKSNGEHINSKFITIPKNEYGMKAGNIISSFISEYSVENSLIRILKLGRIYDELEIKPLDEIINNFPKITIVLIREGIYRIFKLLIKNNISKHQRPLSGTLFRIDKSEYLMITTTIKDEDKRRTQQPIYCHVIHSNGIDNSTILEDIFDLTYAHHGYTLSRTKLPVPLHASRLIQSMFQPYQLENGFEVNSNVEFFY